MTSKQKLDSLFQKGLSALQNSDLEAATKIFAAIVAKQPKHADAWHLQALCKTRLGDLNNAEFSVKQALEIRGQTPNYLNTYGNILKKQGRFDEAAQTYLTATGIDPAFADAYYNLARTRVAQGCLDDAVQSFEQAINVRPEFSQAHNELGLVHMKLGAEDEAHTAFRNEDTE